MLVIKLGGSAGINTDYTLDDLAALWPGERVVFIHGANAALDAFMKEHGREPRLVTSSTGQVSRFTDRETMDDLLAIYAGRVNKRIVEGLQARGVNAVGLSGIDGGIARGTRKDALRVVEDGKPKVLRGDYAGSLKEIDTDLLTLLLDNGYLPVLTPPALSQQRRGDQRRWRQARPPAGAGAQCERTRHSLQHRRPAGRCQRPRLAHPPDRRLQRRLD